MCSNAIVSIPKIFQEFWIHFQIDIPDIPFFDSDRMVEVFDQRPRWQIFDFSFLRLLSLIELILNWANIKLTDSALFYIGTYLQSYWWWLIVPIQRNKNKRNIEVNAVFLYVTTFAKRQSTKVFCFWFSLQNMIYNYLFISQWIFLFLSIIYYLVNRKCSISSAISVILHFSA